MAVEVTTQRTGAARDGAAPAVGLSDRPGASRRPRSAGRQGRRARRHDAGRLTGPSRVHDHDCRVQRLPGSRWPVPGGLWDQTVAALHEIERRAGKRLGDAANPLLVSVRSGARVSMPGMMDTVLNLGLNDETVVGLARQTEQRALRLGRLPPLRADVRADRARHPGREDRRRLRARQGAARRRQRSPT